MSNLWVHTVVNQFPDHEVTLRRGLVRICGGNHCAALLLDYLYERTVLFDGEEFETSTLELAAVLSDLFDDKGIKNALEELFRRDLLEGRYEEEEHGWPLENKGYTSIKCRAVIEEVDYALNALRGIYPEKKVEPQPATPQQLVKRLSAPKQPHSQREEQRVTFHLKRAEKLALPATLSLEQWTTTLEYFEWKCAYCLDGEYQVFEHYIPLLHGGGTTVYNCVPACMSCNSRKRSDHPSTFEGRFPQEAIARIKLYLAEAWENGAMP